MKQKKLGYGIAPQAVFTDPTLGVGSKALFGLLSSWQGKSSKSWYPLVSICAALAVRRETAISYISELKDKPYFQVKKNRKTNGKFANNVYSIDMDSIITNNFEVGIEDEPSTGFPDAVKNQRGILPTRENAYSNNNILEPITDKEITTDIIIPASQESDLSRQVIDIFWQNLKSKGLLPLTKKARDNWIFSAKSAVDGILKQNSLEDIQAVTTWAFQDTKSFRSWGTQAIHPSQFVNLKSDYAKAYVTGTGKVSQSDVDDMQAFIKGMHK